MHSKEIKTAIIGIGRWGKNLLREFNNQSEVLYACHTGSADSRETLASYPHTKSTTQYDEILNDPKVDAVVIATPTNTHFDIALKAIQANKHIFLEKPGGENMDEFVKICEEAEKRNLKVAVGYEFAHHPASQYLSQNISPKEIRLIDFKWLKLGTFNDHPLPHLASHEISILFSLGLKKIVVLSYDELVVGEGVNALKIELQEETNTKISINIDRLSEVKTKMVKLITSDATYLWQDNNLYSFDGQSKSLNKIDLGPKTALENEVDDFLNSIIHNRSPKVNGEFGLEVWKIIEAIKQTL